MNKQILEKVRKKIDYHLESLPLLDNRYSLIATIEEGRFGKVKLAYDQRKKDFVAIKILKKSSCYLAFKHFFSEVKFLLEQKDNKNTCDIRDYNFKGLLKKNNQRYRIMYYTSQFFLMGELFSFLQFSHNLSTNFRLILIKKLFDIIEPFFQNKISHGDLKPENILLTKNLDLVLCDFGTCLNYKSYNEQRRIYTENYAAPEIQNKRTKKIDHEKSEIYSLGVLFYVILRNKYPNQDKEYFSNLCSQNDQFKNLLYLVNQMLHKNIDQRISFKKMKEEFLKISKNFPKKHNDQDLVISYKIHKEDTLWQKVQDELKEVLFQARISKYQKSKKEFKQFYNKEELHQFMREFKHQITKIDKRDTLDKLNSSQSSIQFSSSNKSLQLIFNYNIQIIMQAICLIFNENNSLDNFLCGNDWSNSQKLLCLQNPVNSKVIGKYFTDDEEINTIQDAMVEKPQIFNFDYVFKTQNMNDFFDQYITNQMDKKTSNQSNLVYFLFTTSFLNSFWLSEETKNEENFFINFIFQNVLQNNQQQKIQIQGNFVYQDLVQDIFEEGKITISNMQDLINIFSALNKNLQNFMYKSDLEQELETELILFLKFSFEDETFISFFILPEDQQQKDLNYQTIYRCMISLDNFLQKNVIGQSPKFQSFANIKNQLKENSNLQVQQLLNEHIYDNFEVITIFALEGKEENYSQKVQLIKYLSDICNKFTLKAQASLQKQFSPQFENDNNEEVVQNLKNYINQLENQIQTSQNFEQEKNYDKRHLQQSEMMSEQNSCYQQDLNRELRESQIDKKVKLNLSQTLSKNFQRTQSFHRNNTQQEENFYKIFKEKMARKDDINNFKYAELLRENKFLKMSFTKQNKNFESIRQKLVQVNNQLQQQVKYNQEQKNQIEDIKRKNKELMNKNVLLKSSWDVMKEKICQMESNQKQNNQMFQEQNFDKKTEMQKLQLQLDMAMKQNKKNNKQMLQKDLEIQQLKNDLKFQIEKIQCLTEKLFENEKQFSVNSLQNEQIIKEKDILEKNLTEELQNKKNLQIQIENIKENNYQIIKQHESELQQMKLDQNQLKQNHLAIIQKKDAEYKSLQDQLVALQLSLSEKNQIIQQNQNLQTLQQQTQEQLKKDQQKITQLEKEIIKKENQIQLNEKVLQYETEKTEQLQKDLNDKNEEQKQILLNLKQLETDHQKGQIEIKNQQKILNDNKETINKLNQENTNMKNTIEKQKQKEEKYIKEYEDKFEGVLYQLQQLQQQNLNLENQLEQKKKDYENTKQQLQKKKEKIQIQKAKIQQFIEIQDKYKEELREKICLIHKIQNEKEKKQKKTVKKIAMVSDIRNMIECYKHLSNNNQFFQQTRIKQLQGREQNLILMRSTREGYICPHRIIDDVGSGFSLGLILGGLWNFLKGTYSSPAKERVWGGVMLMKRRAPITGGNFAAWMGLFGFWQCAFLYMTGKDSHINQVMAGALTGGMVNMRGGMHYMFRGFTSGAVFIGVFNIIEILVNKSMFKTEIMKRHVQMRIQNLTEINKYRKIRPDLINVSDDEFEIMKNELNNDVQKFGFFEFYPYMQQAELLN